MRKYNPWRFDPPRAAPYAQGQVFLLFLRRASEDQAAPWRILGIGGEGEMPIDDEYVYFHGRFVQSLERRLYVVHGAEREIQRFQTDLFDAAVRGYSRCFAWTAGAESERPDPRGEWIARCATTPTTEAIPAKPWKWTVPSGALGSRRDGYQTARRLCRAVGSCSDRGVHVGGGRFAGRRSGFAGGAGDHVG